MPKPTSLIFVCELIYPFRIGGAEVFNHYLIRALEPSVPCICLNSHTRASVDGIRHVKIKVPLQRLLFPFLAACSILWLNLSIRPHLVLSFGRSRWFYWMFYPLLRKLFGIRYSIIIHGGGLKRWKFKAPFVSLFRNADHVIGVSDRITAEYKKRTGVEVTTIPPLIPFAISELEKHEARHTFNFKTTSKLIVMVGSLIEIKATDTAIKALAALGRKYLDDNDIVLALGGDGVKRAEFEKVARDCGVAYRVVFLGNVPREKVKHLYRSADIYVMTSKFEGTPISMLEAMANSLPVLVSDAPGIDLIARNGENALLFPIQNSEELASQLKRVLENDELKLKLQKGAKATIEADFSYAKMIESYKSIFEV